MQTSTPDLQSGPCRTAGWAWGEEETTVRLATKRPTALTSVQKMGLLLLGMAVLIAVTGYLNQHRNLYLGEWVGNFLQAYYTNAGTELASIAITVLIVDALYDHRNIEREKGDLVVHSKSF